MDKVVHFEIPFDDKVRAMKFYAVTFGWQLADMPQMDYVMASTVEIDENYRPKEPGAINGGLFKRPKEAPTPVVYVDVPAYRVLFAGTTSSQPVELYISDFINATKLTSATSGNLRLTNACCGGREANSLSLFQCPARPR